MTDNDREELARLIAEGFTSGRLDPGDGRHIAWELSTNEWSDDDHEPVLTGGKT